MKINSVNDNGTVRYLQYSFAGIEGVAEVLNPALMLIKPIHAAQGIVKGQLIQDGKLNEAAVKQFIQTHGTRFSDRQKQLTPHTIILR